VLSVACRVKWQACLFEESKTMAGAHAFFVGPRLRAEAPSVGVRLEPTTGRVEVFRAGVWATLRADTTDVVTVGPAVCNQLGSSNYTRLPDVANTDSLKFQ
jgi:hypothetical protein